MSRPRTQPRRHGSASKRKRQDDGDEELAAKRQETRRPEQTASDETIGHMDPSLMADHWAKAMKKHSSDSATIELEDKYISARTIQDTTSFSKPHVAKHLAEYLERYCGTREELSVGVKSSPHTLVITSSGIRAADLTRELRTFAKDDVRIAKLFAKHMKLKESAAFVEKTKLSIAVGTPNRLKELLESGVLEIGSLKGIVVDGSYVDEKKRTIFDIQEVFLPLLELLNLEKIKSRLDAEEDGIKMMVF